MRIIHLLAPTVVLLIAGSTLQAQTGTPRSRSGMNRFVDPDHSTSNIANLTSSFQPPTWVVSPTAPPSGTVDMRDLMLPPKALKEFHRAMKAVRSFDDRAAATHFENAIRIAPAFVQARNNLSAVYINLRDYEDAVCQAQQAAALSDRLAAPYHNLAMALTALKRLPEAETAARRALELAPNDPSSPLTLGQVLANEGSTTSEVELLLTQASVELPVARLSLALVFQNKGDSDRAIAELRTYLQTAPPSKKAFAEAWIAHLAQQSKLAH